MKTVAIVLFLIISPGLLYAQELEKVAKAKEHALTGAPSDTAKKPWFVQGSGSLNFSQAAFSNWAAGGENSIGFNAYINFKANYRKNKHIWSNTVDLGFGMNILGKSSDLRYTKTNDKIEFTTAYGYQIHRNNKWYLTVLANFRSQFANGYNYPDDSTVISKFMAPGYIVAGIGVTYAPVRWFYLYFSPASARFTFVTDQKLADQGAFGVDPGKNIRGEIGPYMRIDMNKDLGGNVNLSTNLELFTDYLHEFGNIDVNWNLLLSMKVNKWLSASIQTQLLYDNDVMIQTDPTEPAGPRTQFKEILGIGLTYKIN